MKISSAQEKYVQYGIATYYSDAFQGRYTSCGERYNNTLYTAAHATLPFHTLVKVTNLKNGKYVIVKINDRCPKYPNRIIDLSKVAAAKIDIIASGIASIKLEVIDQFDLNVIEDMPDSLYVNRDTVR
jgi:rare lipoprotein A